MIVTRKDYIMIWVILVVLGLLLFMGRGFELHTVHFLFPFLSWPVNINLRIQF
jgi:hypothetical protein